MKISKVIRELKEIEDHYGDIEVNMMVTQSDAPKPDKIYSNGNFWIIPEEYSEEDGGWQANMRTWPH